MSGFEVIVVSSDLESRRQLAGILTKLNHDPISVATLKDCHEQFAQREVGIIFCDPLVSDGNYQDLLGAYRMKDRRPRVVVRSRLADWGQFKEAMRSGAFDVIASPCRPTDVEWMIIQAKREERELAKNSVVRLADASRFAASA
jgi:DNA-binding NtrC family response regulator